MQKDEARKWTDKQLSEMEDKIYKIYAEALESMQVKWDDFAKKIEPEIAVYKKRLDEAIKSGDSATIKEARSQYADVLREKTLMNRYYKDMVDQTIDELSNVNQTAVAYLNDEVAQIYAINYNQFAKDLPKVKSNYVFDLVDASTVKVLATKDDSLLPYKQIDKYKDEAWNRKIINSQILQGIVEGESIDKIAKRLKNVVNADESSAIRNARTMTTSAECKGRIDSYHKAISNGIRMKKVWIATSDDRTRAWHMELDGAEADVDEPFVNEYGEIMQPGDPDADPCNVYNCRCSIKMKFLGFEKPEDENQEQIETSGQEQEALSSAEVGTPMLEYKLEEETVDNEQESGIIETREDAYRVLTEKIGFVGIDDTCEKINEELLVVSTKQLENLENKFGMIEKSHFTLCSVAYKNADAYVGRKKTEPTNAKLSLCPRTYSKSMEELISDERHQVQTHYSMPCSEENYSIYTVTHEYGHIIQNFLIEQRFAENGWDKSNPKEFIDLSKKTEEARYKWYNDLTAEVEIECKNEIKSIAKELDPDFKMTTAVISRYGLKDCGEFFAEVFANSQLGEPNILGKAMNILLERKGLIK